MTTFRLAHEADFAQAYDVFYQNEIADNPTPPPPEDNPSDLQHIYRTGVMYVAEREGHILAFAAAITRGNITFLTDLFVRPDEQSSQLGRTLLERVMPPQEDQIRCTMSSTDPRALALYIRSGMQPQWSHFCLLLNGPTRSDLATRDIKVVEGDSNDAGFVYWDAQISGRERPVDHAHWLAAQGAVPLWFERDGAVVGYGYVRFKAGSLWYPDGCMVGPIGVRRPEDAAACVLAAVEWARQHTENALFIDVPGPHPSLASLLTAGFHITYVETFVSTASVPFFDARCYIASGSNLL